MSPAPADKAEKRKRSEDPSHVSATVTELKKHKKEKGDKKSKKDSKEKKAKKDKKVKNEKDARKEKKSKKEERDDVVVASKNNGDQKESAVGSNQYQYSEHPDLLALPKSQIDKYYKEHSITIQGDQSFRPIIDFKYLTLPGGLSKVFSSFANPTPIQAATWPFSLSGNDIVGIAETGSGKTYAFTVPGLIHIARKARQNKSKPMMLVVSPTRELAMQSEEQARIAGNTMGISTVCLYGGVSKDPQREALKRGVDIIVATPGRLVDLINEGYCDLSQISFLVLDEADRMLDDGFEKDIRGIIDYTPKTRQTLMFSATWPESVRKLANDFLNKPARVTIGSDDLTASQNITQIVEVIDTSGMAKVRDAKKKRLLQLLQKIHKSGKNRILVFALYKLEASDLERFLQHHQYKAIGIHGDKNQANRTEALEKFKDGQCPIMVATDVAARGLDIPDVEYVINFTFPLTIEAYIHRIGRTGRGGKKGTAYTFFTVEDKSHSGELVNVLKQANMEVPDALLRFGTTVKKKQHGAYGAFFKDTSDAPKATKIIFDD